MSYDLLQDHEKHRLQALEHTVKDGLREFQRTGNALSEIRDNNFFRATHQTFEAYLEQRWGFSTQQASRLIDASAVAKVLEPLGLTPENERQARALKPFAKIVTELEPEQQRVIANLIEENAAQTDDTGESPNAAELKIMAGVVKKLEPDTTVYHPDNGEEVPFDTLSRPQRLEVIRTQVDQKTQAYHEKQLEKEQAKAQKEPSEKVNWADWCLNYATQSLSTEQRLEITVQQDLSGNPKAIAKVLDNNTGEVLAEGEWANDLKQAVLSLVAEVKG